MSVVLALLLQVNVQVQISVPTIRFEAPPPVVEVQPGVLVVNDYDQEVFFADSWYWVRWSDGRWYRTTDYRGGWAVAETSAVPVTLVRMPVGRYKHFKAKPEKLRVVNAEGRVVEIKVKEKHGETEVKVKEKKGKKEKKEKKGKD